MAMRNRRYVSPGTARRKVRADPVRMVAAYVVIAAATLCSAPIHLWLELEGGLALFVTLIGTGMILAARSRHGYPIRDDHAQRQDDRREVEIAGTRHDHSLRPAQPLLFSD